METTPALPVFIIAEPCKEAQSGLHEILRRPLEDKTQKPMDVCTCTNLWPLLHKNPQAIVLLNVLLHDFNGEQTLLHIQKTWPQVSVIISNIYYSVTYVDMVNRGLACSYIIKSEALPSYYAKAVEACKQKTKYLTPETHLQLSSSINSETPLTEDERICISLTLQQKKPKEIATAINKSYWTADRMQKDLLKKSEKFGQFGLLGLAFHHRIITMEMVKGGMRQ